MMRNCAGPVFGGKRGRPLLRECPRVPCYNAGMSESRGDWWDRNLSPGSKRFLAWWVLVVGATTVLFALVILVDQQWRSGLSMVAVGLLAILQSVRRLREVPHEPRP